MLFEMCVDPDAVAGLPRRSILARTGARPRRQHIVWYDSPDRSLTEAGVALSNDRGTWRLERLRPGSEDWPPACPAPVLAEGSDPADLGRRLPAALSPAAACEGLVSARVLDTEHGPVEVRRLRGIVRTVAADRPIARLALSGSEPAILSGARLLSVSIAASVPRASLAAEALAAAANRPPVARRLGAPILPGNGSLVDAFAHVLGHLTDVILHYAPAAADPSSGPEPIHQMRVAVRRLRSAIMVFGPATAAEPISAANSALRALAGRLGPAREWDVFLTETAPAVSAAFPGNSRLERLLKAAQRRQRKARIALAAYLNSAEFRQLGVELAWLAGARSWQEPGNPPESEAPLSAFAAEGMQRRFKKLRSAGEAIEDLEIPALHALRLRVKRMRYAAEIMAPLFPAKPTRRFIERLVKLQTRLGALNDAAVASGLMDELGGLNGRHGYAIGLVLGFTGAHASSTRAQINRAWHKLLKQPPCWT